MNIIVVQSRKYNKGQNKYSRNNKRINDQKNKRETISQG